MFFKADCHKESKNGFKTISYCPYQCWTVGAIFTFGRSRMFGPEKLRPLAVGRSRSRRLKKKENICHKIFYQQSFQLNK